MKLKHQRFVEEYARDWNATAAYKRAGYRARGHAAEVNASRLRRRPDVTAAIEAALAAANEPALRTQALLLARFEVGHASWGQDS